MADGEPAARAERQVFAGAGTLFEQPGNPIRATLPHLTWKAYGELADEPGG